MITQAISSPSFAGTDYICVATNLLAKMMTERESLEVNNRRITVAMAAAGHDLRQRLHTLLGTIELLTCAEDQVRSAELSLRAKSLIIRLAGELEQLAFQAEREQSRNVHSPCRFVISSLLEQLRDDWESAAESKYLRFRVEPAGYLVESDPHLLAVILNNVVGNAVKHTAGGTVTVDHTIEGQSLVFAVSDTGPGISEEVLRRSFGFCSPSGTANGGMGLGLAIARRSAEILGHEFEISTRLGGGTCIRLHVPLAISRAM